MTNKLRIIDMLSKYAEVYKHENMGKYFGYSRAKAMVMENIPEDASTEEIKTLIEAGIYGIGSSIGGKIEALIDGKTPEKYDEIVRKYVEYHLDKKVVNPHKHYMLRGQAETTIKPILHMLFNYNYKYEICGSYRRGSEIVGDIDILIIGESLDAWNEQLEEVNKVRDDITITFLAKGSLKSKIELSYKDKVIEIDFRAIMPGQLGPMLLHFTGPREFNIRMRREALRQGYSLNEYGLHKLDGTEDFTSDNELDFFNKLGINYIAPEGRR